LSGDQQRWDDEVIDQSRSPDVTTRVRQQGRHGSPFFMNEVAPAGRSTDCCRRRSVYGSAPAGMIPSSHCDDNPNDC
jgi:hypothetical protein